MTAMTTKELKHTSISFVPIGKVLDLIHEKMDLL